MKNLVLITFLIVNSFLISAQTEGKKVLKPEDYSLWKTIDNAQISDNGRWISYEVNPFTGDGSLYVCNAENNEKKIIPRAYESKFSSNSRFIVFKIKPPEDVVRKAKVAKKKKEQMPKDSLGLMILDNYNVYKYPDFKSFSMPDNNSAWFAFTIGTNEKEDDKDKDSKKSKIKTETLIIADPGNAKFFTFEKVNDYFITKDSKWVGYITNSGDSLNKLEVSIFNTSTAKSFSVFKAEGEAKNLTIDNASSQLAFIFSQDTTDEKVFNLYYASEKQPEAKLIADSNNRNITPHFVVSPYYKLMFSDDNTRLFFGTAPFVKPLPKDTLADDEKTSLDLWSWKDSKPMPQQLADLDKENKRSYVAVYYPATKKIIQLATETVPDVQLVKKNNGRVALGSSALPYDLESTWTQDNMKDYYIVDVESGKKTKILEKKLFTVSLSPEGKFVAYYEEKDSLWYLYDVSVSKAFPLCDKKLTKFYNTDYDNPGFPPPYGIAGWAEDDKSVFIYDKFDIWEFDTRSAANPVNITKDKLEGKIINRYLKLDNEAFCIPKNEDMLIKFVNDETLEEGFYLIDKNDRGKFKMLLKDNFRFTSVIKAKDANSLIFRRSSYVEFSDLWHSDINFSKNKKISNVNPQQSDFLWGNVEIVNWTFKEKKMKGLLYKPENFDPKKKYPMMTYFYEKTSQTLNTYYGVIPSRSVINFPLYNSNGYLIFIPDLEFEIGKPGESALNIVLSGVYALIEKGFVDQSRLGIHGQSWGGYLTAYIISRTPVFKAAMAGAPVSNMTSAYGAIRKETGICRIYQYEAGQSRIGSSLWERRDLYVENSPLFAADKIVTPLLIMANDNDGAVPWSQGVELFLSMRRLQKPVWLVNYNNDEHNLNKKPNRIDLSNRMFQFFNHYLKDEPMPVWMKDGIQAKEKGRTLGY